MSEQALRGAEILLREGDYRGAISRAYYAAYCAITNEIVNAGTRLPHGRQNPTHQNVPLFVQNNLSLAQVKKDAITKLINTLRHFREDADYRPHQTADQQLARDCVRDAAGVQQELW